MMEGLHIGRTGLIAAQRGLEVAGHNVANVNTKGYSRQRVEQATGAPRPGSRGMAGPGATGSGVVVTGVTRLRDRLLDISFRDAVGDNTAWETRSEFLQRAEEVLGPIEGGVPEALDRYWNAWEKLSMSPQDVSSREEVLAAGRNLTQLMNSAANQMYTLQVDAAGRASELINEVNRVAADVVDYNRAIQEATARGDSPNDMLDAREVAFDRLSELVGARVFLHEDGSSTVTVNGLPLVDGVRDFPLAEDPGPPLAVRWESDGRAAGVGGRLGAIVELSTSTLTSLSADLDQFAVELSALVNTAHGAGVDLDGNAGGAFFTGTNAGEFSLAAGLTARTVAASAAGAATDGNHALVMGELRDSPLASGATPAQTLGAFASRLGLLTDEAIRNSDSSQSVVDGIDRQRMEASAVSIDEELTDMLRYQRAFEASARVITVIDEMLNKLINGTGSTR
ncbi:MAG: flagellar hook-associated protein FlgK [Acidimicrobiales bacterium]|nr:flagellar hook-associated protein FlgK [Acidimicrobiales bacterium]